MRLVTRTGTVLGLMLVLGLLAMACGGGDDAKSSTSPGVSSTATQGGGGPTSNGDQQLTEAAPALSAYHLLDLAGYSAALGEPVTAVEDDGVVPDQYGCEVGQARALTAAGALITTTLRTAKSEDDAREEYSTMANFFSTPVPLNVGDQSGSTDGFALVQKGAQVLQVTSNIAPGVDPKANGADPTAALAAAAAIAGKAAPKLATNMGGAACSGPAMGLPAGAVPPCPVTAEEMDSGLGITGTKAIPVISDDPPSMECQYQLPAKGTVLVYSWTEAQLENSIAPGTAADAYDAALATATNPRTIATKMTQSFEAGQFKGFGYTASGPTSPGLNNEVLFTNAITNALFHPAATQPVPTIDIEPAHAIILRVIEESSNLDRINIQDCQTLMDLLLGATLKDVGSDKAIPSIVEEYAQTLSQMTEACKHAVAQAMNP